MSCHFNLLCLQWFTNHYRNFSTTAGAPGSGLYDWI